MIEHGCSGGYTGGIRPHAEQKWRRKVPGGAAGLQNQSGGRKVLGGFDSLPSPPVAADRAELALLVRSANVRVRFRALHFLLAFQEPVSMSPSSLGTDAVHSVISPGRQAQGHAAALLRLRLSEGPIAFVFRTPAYNASGNDPSRTSPSASPLAYPGQR